MFGLKSDKCCLQQFFEYGIISQNGDDMKKKMIIGTFLSLVLIYIILRGIISLFKQTHTLIRIMG